MASLTPEQIAAILAAANKDQQGEGQQPAQEEEAPKELTREELYSLLTEISPSLEEIGGVAQEVVTLAQQWEDDEATRLPASWFTQLRAALETVASEIKALVLTPLRERTSVGNTIKRRVRTSEQWDTAVEFANGYGIETPISDEYPKGELPPISENTVIKNCGLSTGYEGKDPAEIAKAINAFYGDETLAPIGDLSLNILVTSEAAVKPKGKSGDAAPTTGGTVSADKLYDAGEGKYQSGYTVLWNAFRSKEKPGHWAELQAVAEKHPDLFPKDETGNRVPASLYGDGSKGGKLLWLCKQAGVEVCKSLQGERKLLPFLQAWGKGITIPAATGGGRIPRFYTRDESGNNIPFV